jgi:hypothetical protein
MSEQRDFVLARAGVALAAINSLRDSVMGAISMLAVGEGAEAGELLEEALDETHIVASALGQAQTGHTELSDDELGMSEDLADDDDEADDAASD